jgi:hypothetical protein
MFVRRVTQVILISASFLVLVGCIVFDYIVIGYYFGLIDATNSRWAYGFIEALGGFYSNDWTPLFTTIAGVFPVVVSSVCYKISVGNNDVRITDLLNRSGHTFFLIVVSTALLLLVALLILTTLHDSIAQLGGAGPVGEKNFSAIKQMANAGLSVYAIYIVQIIGLRTK